MSDLSTIPLQDWFETQLSQEWNWATGTVYVLATPSYTPTTTPTYIVVNPWKTTMQIAKLSNYDSGAKTLTVSSISFEKGLGISSTAQTHPTGSKVIISDNYQYWEDIQTAIASKLDIGGGNATIYATTTARDTALGANGVATLPYTDIYVSGTGLFYNYNLSTAQWETQDTGTPPWNASTSASGLVRTDVAPAWIPVALITDNPKYDALAGTSGTAPSWTNKLVDNADTDGTWLIPRASVLSSLDAATFGSWADGNVTISADTSLTRDMYYNNLTINNTFTLSPKWYRIFVAGTLNCIGSGKIASNGWAGGSGWPWNSSSTTVTGGTAWARDYTTGSLPIPKVWVAGNTVSGWGNGVNGTAWTATSLNLSEVLAVAGGDSGRGSYSATVGTGGAAWSGSTFPTEKPYNFIAAYKLYDLVGSTLTKHDITPTGGSGGGGGGNWGSNFWGSGGGSGSSGGCIFIAAKTITNLNVEAIGWAGGNWGAATVVNVWGGGGGAGGNGWVVIILYRTKTTVTSTVTGGAGGTWGAASSGTSTAWANGTAWNSGVTYQIAI